MRVPIGYKFIIGFIVVVAAAAFAPDVVRQTNVPEWLQQPVSFLTAIVIGLILGAFFTRNIAIRFNRLTDAARRISLGDLKSDGEIAGASRQTLSDETAELEEAIGLMLTNLRALVEHMQTAVSNLAEAQETFSAVVAKGQATSREVVTGTSSIFEGARAQALHLGEAARDVGAMTALADDVASEVTDTANASQRVNSMVQRGATAATSAIEKMETIFKGIENTERASTRLKDKLSDIPKILDVITHISRQTDLLALNATIEASKAGEHGRGFAMVAEEVRRFADYTKTSVEDVSLIVKELRVEVERVVTMAGEGVSYIKEGRDDLRKIREILSDITNYSSEVASKATMILSLTAKQKAKAGETSGKMDKVAGIARDNVKSAEQVESAVGKHGAAINDTIEASKKLSELSAELKALAAQFSLK